MRWRTMAAGAGLLGGLLAYLWLAATIGGDLPEHWTIQLVYYAVAGILWIFPAARLIAWSRRDGSSG